ncbi:hypothetical protein OsI_20471 [Oryza sativa Indica Group]|uniref:RING-type domain-containing protein n=1 Tax=Oryza sativa subsp. indica TaxID=39946 RepID=B8AZJ8_ORYSI|nr:hypothetical protein OsI_20471 [Oryza sativa Indica Group]
MPAQKRPAPEAASAPAGGDGHVEGGGAGGGGGADEDAHRGGERSPKVMNGGGPEKEKERRDADSDAEEEEEEAGGGGGGGGADEDRDSPSSESDGDMDEFILVKLMDIRKEVQCPICLGIIRKTRTVMECLHRFCRDCIDKSMRLGNNECPACRTHCASRRSLRDDPNYDALILALYPDIDKYEEEELAFSEEERTRNKKIQASIAETFRRQSEALVKKRSVAKATGSTITRRTRGNMRAKRRGRTSSPDIVATDNEDEDRDENGNEGSKESSSVDDRSPDFNLYLVLLPLNGQSMPKLEKPYLSCQPTFSVRHLCQFVALQLSRHAKEVEIFIRKNPNNGCFASIDTSADEIKLNHDALERLEEEKSLSELYPSLASGHGDLAPWTRYGALNNEQMVGCRKNREVIKSLLTGAGLTVCHAMLPVKISDWPSTLTQSRCQSNWPMSLVLEI